MALSFGARSFLSHRDFFPGGGARSSEGFTPDEAKDDDGGSLLKKSTNACASIVADEIIMRREGRTRRILTPGWMLSVFWRTRKFEKNENLLFQNAKEKICVSTSFVSFIHHDDRISG